MRFFYKYIDFGCKHNLSIPAILVTCGFVLAACIPNPISTPEATVTPEPTEPPGDITISIKDELGQDIKNGVVRVTNSNQADDFDHDEYRVGPCNADQYIVVWVPGYQTSFTRCNGQPGHYDVSLHRLNTLDNPAYSWVAAGTTTSPPPNCASCHADRNDTTHNEFDEWQKSGHAKVFSNRFFQTVYLGTDINGYKSPDTIRDIIDDHLVQRAPTIDANYHGPGFKLDFPDQNGNCAFCHAPASVSPAMIDVNLSQYFPFPGGAIEEGITCDICHKVIGMQLDNNGYPYVDRPGILSFQFLRPGDDPNLAIGPLTSFTKMNTPSHTSTCSSIFSKSEFCAACHYGKFSDTLIYGSYQEWKNSSFAVNPNSKSYRTCQDCHMLYPRSDLNESLPAQRQACAAQNTSYTNFDHNLMNYGHDENTNTDIPRMIREAAVINAEFAYDPNQKNWFTIRAKVHSKDVGHKFPTDSPLRHLILIVEVRDQRGTLLAQVDGDRIPIWGGTGDLASENSNNKLYAGLPGKIYAHLLAEEDTNVSPTTAYWNETKLSWIGNIQENPSDNSDTRLIPGQTDTSRYSFEVPNRGDINVTIKLIYRFAFYDLMRQKGWNRPDILVTQKDWNCKRLNNSAGFDCIVK